MFTLLLAFVNAKYRSDYGTLFFATFLMDMYAITMIGKIFGAV